MIRLASLFAIAVALFILWLGWRLVRNRWRLKPRHRPYTVILGAVLFVFLGGAVARVIWEWFVQPVSVRAALDLLFVDAGFLLGYGLTARGDRS